MRYIGFNFALKFKANIKAFVESGSAFFLSVINNIKQVLINTCIKKNSYVSISMLINSIELNK